MIYICCTKVPACHVYMPYAVQCVEMALHSSSFLILTCICRLCSSDVNICSLPDDCLRLILSKVDFGGNKEAVWAITGSCKALQQALADCPAIIELQGEWDGKQLLGLNSPISFHHTTCRLNPPTRSCRRLQNGTALPSRGELQRKQSQKGILSSSI